MPAPLALRIDYDGAALRLLALASLYEGGARYETARQASVTPQIVRDWVERFNADGPSGLLDRKAPGRMAHHQ